ncbi:MAG: hypothetical protein IT307_18880, partial [Chloroflexi bacterium]|nr:hypothetical protein [Chloroflexota bacterium]
MARGTVERRGWRRVGGAVPTFRLPSPGILEGRWLPASALQRQRVWRRVRRAAVVRRPFVLLAAALPDALAIVFLLAQVLYVFRDAWQSGLVFHEEDTSTMFYPVFAAFTDALERGSLLLWTTDLFSGFPLLAEGQTGVLYPPNHLFANLFGARDGFVWLRVFHFGVASIGAYLFGRSMRLSPGAAAVGATSFGLGSFLVGQMQHGSVLASAAWLPLVLALTEWGVRARGLAQQRLLVLTGLVLGMSALGVHIQTVVLSAGCFVGWVVFRALIPCAQPRPTRSAERVVLARSRARAWLPRRNQAVRASQRLGLAWTFRVPALRFFWLVDVRAVIGRACRAILRAITRLARVAWALVVIPVLAVAIAAPQLLPLLELSGFSLRAGGWSYQAATDYSLPVPNLITLVFPFFFRDEHGLAWSLWQPWEVTYYAGIVSLALVVLAVLLGRRRELFFFVPVVAVSTLLALGDYSPINLYAELWALPVMNLQRAPARFSLLGTLALAMMAALGAQALWDRLPPRVAGRPGSARLLVVWQGLVISFVVVAIGTMISWRTWLAAHPLDALAYINQVYLGLRRDPGVVDSAQRVYSGLWSALDPSAWHTALPLLLLCAAFLLTAAWNEMRRLRLVWASLLVLLVAVDLTTFAHDYHPTRQIDDIADVGPVGRYLATQTRLAGEDVGKDVRVLTDPNVERPKANELLPWSVAEVRAYDPLELSRHRAFVGSATYVNNWLLDLLRVRFLVQPSSGPGLPSFRQVAFHPQHPLVSGTAFNPTGAETWSIGGDVADELRVVTALEDGFSLTDGEVVGEWTVVARDGTEVVLPMRAGEQVSDWTYDDPVYATRPAHHRATVAFAFDLPAPNGAGA